MPLIKGNPLTTTSNYDYTHFCQFLIVLEYSPIGVNHYMAHPVHCKNKNFQHYFVSKVLKYLSNFLRKKTFLNLILKIHSEDFFGFLNAETWYGVTF